MAKSSKKLPKRPFPTYGVRLLAGLVPDARNARTHSSGQVEQIRASIRRFGFTAPVLIDEAGGIIAGHGRVLAAQLEGYADVPTCLLAGLTVAEKRAYMIADNRLALSAGWDLDILQAEVEFLRGADFDLGLLGFDPGELALAFPAPQPVASHYE